MNWGKAVLTGVVGGGAVWLYSGLVHGFIMSGTYEKTEYADVFRVGPGESASFIWFLVVSVVLGIVAALLFGKSRASWATGVKGGVIFGFWLGLFSFFAQFYFPLIIQGFPYFLSWCWGGINLIGWLIFGAIAGVMYKQPAAAV